MSNSKIDNFNILSRKLSNNRTAIYNKVTNELIITHGDDLIGTYMKPVDGIKYFNNLK